MILGKSGKNFRVPLDPQDKEDSCSEKECSIVVNRFPLFSGRKTIFIELEMDARFANLRSSRETIDATECLNSLSSDPVMLAREFKYTLLPAEETYLNSIKSQIPCGTLNAMFFLLERDFVFRKSLSSSLALKQTLLPNFGRFATPENPTLSYSFYSWISMLRHSSRSQFYIGELDEDLPKIFSITFRRGADIGLRRSLTIVSENEIKFVLGIVLVVAGAVLLLLGVAAHFLCSLQASVSL